MSHEYFSHITPLFSQHIDFALEKKWSVALLTCQAIWQGLIWSWHRVSLRVFEVSCEPNITSFELNSKLSSDISCLLFAADVHMIRQTRKIFPPQRFWWFDDQTASGSTVNSTKSLLKCDNGAVVSVCRTREAWIKQVADNNKHVTSELLKPPRHQSWALCRRTSQLCFIFNFYGFFCCRKKLLVCIISCAV